MRQWIKKKNHWSCRCYMKFPHFTDHKSSLPCLQETDSGLYSERRDSECSFYTCMWTKNFVIHSILLLVLRSGPFLVTVSKCVYISFTPTRCRKTHIKQDKHVRFISTLNKLLNSRVSESLNSNGMAFHVTVHYMWSYKLIICSFLV